MNILIESAILVLERNWCRMYRLHTMNSVTESSIPGGRDGECTDCVNRLTESAIPQESSGECMYRLYEQIDMYLQIV
jgi:hypothetical protein